MAEYQATLCPDCGGEMWDNRAKKANGTFNAKGPDFSCKNKDGCGKVIWPSPAPKGAARRALPAQPVGDYDDGGHSAWGVNKPDTDFTADKPPVKNEVWEAKDLRIARESALGSVSRVMSAKINSGYETTDIAGEMIVLADRLIKFIYEGNTDE